MIGMKLVLFIHVFVIFLILELITQTVLIKYIFFIAHHFEVYYVLLSPQMQPLHLIGI